MAYHSLALSCEPPVHGCGKRLGPAAARRRLSRAFFFVSLDSGHCQWATYQSAFSEPFFKQNRSSAVALEVDRSAQSRLSIMAGIISIWRDRIAQSSDGTLNATLSGVRRCQCCLIFAVSFLQSSVLDFLLYFHPSVPGFRPELARFVDVDTGR